MGSIKIKSDCVHRIKVMSAQTHNLRMDETKEKGGIPTKVLGVLKPGEELKIEAEEYWHPRSVIIQTETELGNLKMEEK